MSERFVAAVAAVLRDSGWTDGRRINTADTVDFVCQQVGRHGARFERFDAADAAIAEFGGLYVVQDGPGIVLRRRPFAIDPTRVAATAETLADFGNLLGTRLFPLGLEGEHESIIAIDQSGRVFALDHAGEWYLGDSIDVALSTLITGADQPRVKDNGGW